MASTSSSRLSPSSSHPNQSQTITFDVFLSFRGEDTRHTFTDHLYHALLQTGLRVFRDNDEIPRGEELKPEIESAIMESRASVVVLSENYADSRWCLDELCLILEQRRNCKHFLLPIFYRVDPSDVRNQRGSFTVEVPKWTDIMKVANVTGMPNCLACLGLEAKDGSKWTQVNVRRWKEALKEVANLTGMKLSGSTSERDFIAEVVEVVYRKLDLKQLSTPPHLIGMEARAKVINSWLQDEQDNTLAICGMGGSGKTTLARFIYNIRKQDYQSSSFIEVNGKQADDLLGLQKQLLEDVLGRKDIKISSIPEGTYKIEEVLKNKRVLLVLDDIDKHEQLCALLGTKAFLTRSKVIVTTRVLSINSWFGSISWKSRVHEISLLNELESVELFSWHAFGSKTPMEGFKELAMQLTQHCGGNPLALKVLGSSLFVSDEELWIRNSMIEIWRSRVKSLNSLRGDLDCDIQDVLTKSFDSLPLPSHRELFLHIACFFVGESRYVTEMILEDELYAKSGILTLFNRCLLTISPYGELMMHPLLQELGRRIVCEESKDPAKRTRVLLDVESYHLLRKGAGSDTIEGLALDMRKVTQMARLETLETSSLANMDKLKLLQLKYVQLTGSYEKFPELIWLCWHGCPLKTVPFGLLMSSLVVIDMSYGDMEKFEAPTVLQSLKILYLQNCGKLLSISSLYRLPKLENLNLWKCRSLTHLCKSITDLESLSYLNLGGCNKLWKNENERETMMELAVTDHNLESNSHISMAFPTQSSFTLYLGVNLFEYLPSKIDLQMLQYLRLHHCPNLKYLPCIPSTLKELCIDWCTSLERVTFQSSRFSLQEFSYECCFKLYEIQGLFKLIPVSEIDEADLGQMQWIKAYEHHKVDLAGDDITKGRIWYTQMLYEYGIMSTYLQGIKDQSIPTCDYTSSSGVLSFYVPSHHEKNKIRGLNVSFLYRSSGSKDNDMWSFLVGIKNITKGLTWVYDPVVYCKPKGDEDVLWLSYWPIRHTLDVGDEIVVLLYMDEGMMIENGLGASLVYMDDGEIEKEEYCDNNMMEEEEVIGGDLSEFEVAKGGYYLCRRDLYGPQTTDFLKVLFGDRVHYTDPRGWRKTHQSKRTMLQRDYLNTCRKTVELGVSFKSEAEMEKIEKAVSSLEGVESVYTDKEGGKLVVSGYVDPVAVATYVREFDNMVVEILPLFKPDEWRFYMVAKGKGVTS